MTVELTRKYTTRDGRRVRLISDQGSEEYPIIGIIEGNTTPDCWMRDGKYNERLVTESDLIPEKQVLRCWVNFYENGGCSAIPALELADYYAEVREKEGLSRRIGEAVEVIKVVEV